MSTDMIRFDVLVQDALRGVVRKVLAEVARAGLPGEHHFYVTFDTTHAGVRVSSRVKARYPEEMTIVLQHQFWDLNVSETGFDVGLSFGGIPEKLVIPFAAVKGFFDPSVQFGLQFEVAKADGEASAPSDAGTPVGRGATPTPTLAPIGAPTGAPTGASTGAPIAPLPVGKQAPVDVDLPADAPAARDDVVAVDSAGDDDTDDDGKAGAPQSATVVSLDQFRKKT